MLAEQFESLRARHFGAKPGTITTLVRTGLIATDEIWAFMAGALRLTAGSGIEKNGRDKVA
jgi:hypothetical protein